MTHVCCKLEQSNYDFPLEFKILGLDDKNNGFLLLFFMDNKNTKNTLGSKYIYIYSLGIVLVFSFLMHD